MPAPFRSYGLLKGAAIVVVILLVTGPAVFLPTTPSQADIGVDAIVATTNQSCDPCTWNHTVTTGGSDRILVVGIAFNNAGSQTISRVTYAGAALTKVRSDINGTQGETSIWYRLNPATGTNTVVVDFSAAPTAVHFVSLSFLGVDQANPIDAHAGATAESDTATVNITTSVADAWIIDTVITQKSLTMIAQAGRTERMNGSGGSESLDGASSTLEAAAATTYTMDRTLEEPKKWAIRAVSLTPSKSATDIATLVDAFPLNHGLNRTESSAASLTQSVVFTIQRNSVGPAPPSPAPTGDTDDGEDSPGLPISMAEQILTQGASAGTLLVRNGRPNPSDAPWSTHSH